LGFDIEKVFSAYRTFEKQTPGLDKSLEKEKGFVPPPEQLKETKVQRYVCHNFKRQAKAKLNGWTP